MEVEQNRDCSLGLSYIFQHRFYQFQKIDGLILHLAPLAYFSITSGHREEKGKIITQIIGIHFLNPWETTYSSEFMRDESILSWTHNNLGKKTKTWMFKYHYIIMVEELMTIQK